MRPPREPCARKVFVLGIILLVLGACSAGLHERPTGPATDWRWFGGSPGGGHYSAASEIVPSNVSELELVWTHRSGDFHQPSQDIGTGAGSGNAGTSFQSTPLLDDGTLFYVTPYNRVFALNPSTGAQLWVFDPRVEIDPSVYTPPSRGLSSWHDASAGEECSHTIFLGTIDARLIALDASTGLRCSSFGTRGEVDLVHGLSPHERIRDYAVTSPPAILGDSVIVGSWVIDGSDPSAPSGVVRAYDARSGAFLWGWNAVPPGGEQRNPDGSFIAATANVWSLISVDTARNLVFVPTGNPYPDYYGVDRKGLDYYSSSVVALNGSNGEPVWRFQTVHHDIWDFDVPSQPTLVDLIHDEREIPALVQVTKMGLTFVLHRESGEPLFPVVERPVPQAGGLPNEILSPTQPFPVRPPPLVQQQISKDDAWGLTYFDRNACREKLENLLTGPIYTPPSIGGTAFFPSQLGGQNWGSPAIDPERKLMVATTNHIPTEARLTPRSSCDEERVVYPQHGTPYCYSAAPLVSPLGIPCTAPPWGTISAVDIQAGEIVWTRPMGAVGAWPLSVLKGGITVGGPLITAPGLIFVGASQDPYFRALDLHTGRELWRHKLPTTANSVPMTYRVSENGRQFVVVAVGGHWTGISEAGDFLMAFALPPRLSQSTPRTD